MIPSPCINKCKLGPDNICTGCFRTKMQIEHWSVMRVEAQKKAVLDAGKRKSKARAGWNDPREDGCR